MFCNSAMGICTNGAVFNLPTANGQIVFGLTSDATRAVFIMSHQDAGVDTFEDPPSFSFSNYTAAIADDGIRVKLELSIPNGGGTASTMTAQTSLGGVTYTATIKDITKTDINDSISFGAMTISGGALGH